HLGRGAGCYAKQSGFRPRRRQAVEANAGVLSTTRRRRGGVPQRCSARRSGGLLLSVPSPYAARTAELHGAFPGRQGGVLGADAKPGARRKAGGGDLGIPESNITVNITR